MEQQVQKLRKHRIEMTAAEIEHAENVVHSIKRVNAGSPHLLHEMKQDDISLTDVAYTLKYGAIIEVNSFGRCVVRLMDGTEDIKPGTCVVVQVRDSSKPILVTAWRNNPNDHHKTLRLSEYGWNVDITKYLGGLQ